jgi:hypothetical protein
MIGGRSDVAAAPDFFASHSSIRRRGNKSLPVARTCGIAFERARS